MGSQIKNPTLAGPQLWTRNLLAQRIPPSRPHRCWVSTQPRNGSFCSFSPARVVPQSPARTRLTFPHGAPLGFVACRNPPQLPGGADSPGLHGSPAAGTHPGPATPRRRGLTRPSRLPSGADLPGPRDFPVAWTRLAPRFPAGMDSPATTIPVPVRAHSSWTQRELI